MRRKEAVLLMAVALLFSACSKKEEVSTEAAEAAADAETSAQAAAPAEAPAVTEPVAAESLPGENAVRGSLAAKNYDAAVTQLLGMKKGLPAEMWETYTGFYVEVRNVLIEASQTDPKARQALTVLSAMTAGR